MSLAWGGHQNGRIPLSQLAPIGKGALPGGMQFGKQQYVHPVVARAWAALVRAVHAETGVRLKVTEGYRDFALQQHYWNTLPFPQAAYPGTSSHGWARAVDMYGYTVSALQAVRRIGPRYGWSLATGDRVGEPWHIEYVASLTSPPDFADGGTTTPITPTIDEDEMLLVRREGTPARWSLFSPLLAGETSSERGYIETTNATVGLTWERMYANGANTAQTEPATVYSQMQAQARVTHTAARRGLAWGVWLYEQPRVGTDENTTMNNHLRVARKASEDALAAVRALESGGGSSSSGGFTAADRQRLQAVPTAEQNGQAARAEIVK